MKHSHGYENGDLINNADRRIALFEFEVLLFQEFQYKYRSIATENG